MPLTKSSKLMSVIFAVLWVFEVACGRLSRLGVEAICSAAFFCGVQQS